MADEGVVTSGADLAAMAPPDLFAGISDTTATSSEGAATESTASPAEIETIEAPAELASEGETQETPVEETTEQPEQQEAAATTEQQKKTGQPEQELPEGVLRGKDRNGKPGLFVEESRWNNIYGNHKLVEQISGVLGEQASLEALQLRNDAYIAQERLYNDLTSGDAATQGKVIDYFLDEMARAREEGEVANDATIPFAQTVYSVLREKSPDAYANLRMLAARDLIGEMFEEAAAHEDKSLWLSAQHFARALANVDKGVTDIGQISSIAERMGIPFFTMPEKGLSRRSEQDGFSRLRAENERLRAQIEGRAVTSQAAQFDSWYSGMSQSVNKAVLDEAVKPALASVESTWKQFPDDYNRLVIDPLHREVVKTIRADEGFKARIELLHAQAKRAASAQRRDEIGRQIQQAYINRAKLAAEAVKKPILQFAATRLKEQADQNHARLQNGQNRTGPRGTAGTVPRPLLPKNGVEMGEYYDPKVAVRQALALLS